MLDRVEPEALHVFSPIMLAAAFDARNASGKRPDAGKNGVAFRAGVEELSLNSPTLKGEIVAAGLVGNAKIAAGLAPLTPVGINPAPTRPVLRQQVGQLVSQCPLDLCGGNFEQLWIKNDPPFAPRSETGSCSKAGIPTHKNMQATALCCLQKLVCKILQQRIRPQSGGASRLRQFIWSRANTPQDRTSEIHDQLFVFHSTGEDWSPMTRSMDLAACSIPAWHVDAPSEKRTVARAA